MRYPHKVKGIMRDKNNKQSSERSTRHTGSHSKARKTIIQMVWTFSVHGERKTC